MNVCLVAYTFFEVDTRVRMYVEALVERGDRVDVITLRRSDQKAKEVLNGVTIHRIQKRSYNEKNILDFAAKILSFFIKGSFLLLRLHFKYRYRLIHVHNVPDFLVFMALIPKLLGAKIILDIHDILPEFYCEKFGKCMGSTLPRVMLLVEKVSTRFADHVIAANDLWRDKIISRDKISPQACTSIINYPRLELFGETVCKASDKELKIIYPGTISHHHGLDIMIRALNIVKKEIPSVSFEIYTRSNNLGYYRFLQSLIDELGLDENVRVFDAVPSEELLKILPRAGMGVVPKRRSIFAAEAFSTKILEFMAAGVPVIASRTKIDEYYFDDSMILFFEPEDYNDLSRCILELYENPNKRETLVEHGRQFVAKNNWGIKKLKYLNLVDRLTNSENRKS